MTRFAVLSDIHSNIWALDAVLADARKKQVDQLINLGDILYGPLAPKATYERLQSEAVITIRGNQDRQIYEATDAEIAANPTLSSFLKTLGRHRWNGCANCRRHSLWLTISFSATAHRIMTWSIYWRMLFRVTPKSGLIQTSLDIYRLLPHP